MIIAGKLRHRADLEYFDKSATGDRGQPVGAWAVFCPRVWVEIVPLSGRQLEQARQLVATATHRVTLRYREGVLPGMRVTWQGRHFGIGHVGEGDMKRHELILSVTEQKTGAT